MIYNGKYKFDICFHDFQDHSTHSVKEFYISAGTLISNIKVPSDLFAKFMTNYEKDKDYYKNLFKIKKSPKYDGSLKYPYGIDEMFLNSEFK